MSTCPRCGKNYDGHPALSRVDNATYICSNCGTTEAIEDLARVPLTPKSEWVVKPRIQMNVESNLGYAPDQIDQTITLADLLNQVQSAINEWGADAEVVLHQTNNAYGANYGRLLGGYDLFDGLEEDEDY